MRSSLALPILFLLSLGSAHAAIIEGIEAKSDEFPEVFAISVEGLDLESRRTLCTAVLVHPEVLLTSAHCLPRDESIPVQILSGTDVRGSEPVATSIRTIRHTTFDRTQDQILSTGYDFGLILLSSPLSGVKPARLASIQDETDLATIYQDGVTAVGYGGKNTIQIDPSTGVKRWGDTRVAESTKDTFSTLGPHSALSRGDSGGPAYLFDPDGRRRLVGIASGSPSDEITEVSGRPTVSLYAGLRPAIVDWIENSSGKTL